MVCRYIDDVVEARTNQLILCSTCRQSIKLNCALTYRMYTAINKVKGSVSVPPSSPTVEKPDTTINTVTDGHRQFMNR